jgi:arginase
MNNKQKVPTTIFYYNSAAGQLKNGVQFGPERITFELQKKYDIKIIKPLNEKPPKNVNSLNYDEISDDCYVLYKTILENPKNNPLFLGGDHSMGIATVSAMLELHDDLFVVWIDAHTDINTSETSLSNNIHGMPLGLVTGLERKYKFDWIKKYLSFDNLLYIGVRDIDDEELQFVQNHNIKVITVEDIQTQGIEKITDSIRKIIGNRPIHISLDVDGIDPKYIPSTGTKADNGLELEDVSYLISKLKKDNLKSMDIAELNPISGNDEDIKKSIDNTVYLIEQYIKF